MARASNAMRVFQRICDLTRGDRTLLVHCESEIGAPLGLTDTALWRAIDILRTEDALAVEDGGYVRLTEVGAQRCVDYLRRQVD